MLFETKNWKDRFAKGPSYHAQNPLGTKNKLQRGPWPEVGEGAGGAGRFPAPRLADGEGKEVGELEDFELYRFVGLIEVGDGRRCAPRGEQRAAAGVDGGGDRPAG